MIKCCQELRQIRGDRGVIVIHATQGGHGVFISSSDTVKKLMLLPQNIALCGFVPRAI